MKYKTEEGGFPRELKEEIEDSDSGFVVIYDDQPAVKQFEITERDAHRLKTELSEHDQDSLTLLEYGIETWPDDSFHLMLGEHYLRLVGDIPSFHRGLENFLKQHARCK